YHMWVFDLLVTGANKGIGFVIVRELCKAKFTGDVILTARNEKLGNEAVKMLKSEGFEVAYHRLDLCDQGSAKQLSNFLQKTYGGLDVLINNPLLFWRNMLCNYCIFVASSNVITDNLSILAN
uniref:Carbonyl reductase 1 n=1 Tax=Hucho hucho TaxID=62062 RepID=A0A4W5J9Z4_9TELE